MADSIVRLKVDSQEYDNKLKRAAEQLNRYADGCRKVGGTLEHVDEGVLEFTRSLGKMETTANTARGKLAEMTKAFTEMSVQYKNMTEEEKNGEFGKALNASLNELKGRIQESKTQLDDVSKSLNSGGGLSGALDAVAGKFGLSIDQVTKFGSVLGVATTAAQVAKDAFFQSESGIDEWGRTVEGAKGAYNIFLDTLNNGNWSNFFQNLQTAIQGGRDLYDIFDRLGSIKSNNAAAIAMVQQQIAQLRLAKQQGENVDAQLKAATAQLAQLQKQSITAGKAAGTKSAFEVIRNGVNSVGGARYNDATINYVIGNIMKNGQSEFDKYRNNYQTLRNRGMVTKTQTIYDSQGGTYERQYKEFDINALTKEQQKQYSLAKAITEGETRIQKGIAAYAQAVQEGTASAREEFKGNRYALQGAGGGKGGNGGGNTGPTYAADSIAAQQALVQQLTKQWNEAGADVRDQYLQPLVEAEAKLKEMQNTMALQKAQAEGKLNGVNLWQGDIDDISGGKRPQFAETPKPKDFLETMKGFSLKQQVQLELTEQDIKVDEETIKTFLQDAIQNGIDGMDLQFYGISEQIAKGINIDNSVWQGILDQYNELREKIGLKPIKINFDTGGLQESNKVAGETTKKFSSAAGAIRSVGSAMQSIEDPTTKVAGMIAEAIASIALGFSQAIGKDIGEKGNVWYGIATAAAGIASMVSTISSVKSASRYAEGGIVKGNSYSGDNIPILANAGEVILNRAQQGALASQLQDVGLQNIKLEAYVTGEQIRLVSRNTGRRTNNGETLSFKNG